MDNPLFNIWAHPTERRLNERPPIALDLDRLMKLAIGADAHWESGLDVVQYGIDQACRGWLEADDVLNTRPWSEIAPLFDR